ncbi:MAG: tryptophanase [Candidatus Riflebacteria bacterium]|nr:tryptophanase [Candidatus Riflebacteria bacterium]
MKSAENLGVAIPSASNLVIRPIHWLTVEQRYSVQKSTEFNAFAFPASMLVCDYLSDSGTSSMTDLQWAAMFRGDEAYGRNHGYFGILDTVRDIFERGDEPHKLINKIIVDEQNLTWQPDAEQLENPPQGGFVNGGIHQLTRPNFFLTPQGRCAENLLFSSIKDALLEQENSVKFTTPFGVVRDSGQTKESQYFIPSNGFFDTTEAQAHVNKLVPINMFSPEVTDSFPSDQLWNRNPFKGNIDVRRLLTFIEEKGPERVPLILLTITNNTAAGQPVSMANIRDCYNIAKKYDIPLFFDAARFAENAWFIKEFEKGYEDRSIPMIVKEMFSYADGFTMSLKKDGVCNIGGFLAFRDKGTFHRKFSKNGRDIGIIIKEKQILNYGNDSYGGLSGRDIMAAAVGLSAVVQTPYLKRRVHQTRRFAEKLVNNGVPVVLPPGGHAIYLDMTKFFAGTDMKIDDFGGVGFVIELIRLYGIRACELGPFAFEWDQKTEEQRKGILNYVRFAIPRNMYNEDHIDYSVAAITELYKNKHLIPKVRISRGAELHLRHFQSGLQPVYPPEAKI